MDLTTNPFSSAASTVANSLTGTSKANAAATTAGTTGTTGTTGTSSSTTAAATAAGDITSSDFLTLLVTEMKNQDPTQPTDPNAYIQQLVGVNSLQQLISINSELSTI